MNDMCRNFLHHPDPGERLRHPCWSEAGYSVDEVTPLIQHSATSTLMALRAKHHHAATAVDREDNHAAVGVQIERALIPAFCLNNYVS